MKRPKTLRKGKTFIRVKRALRYFEQGAFLEGCEHIGGKRVFIFWTNCFLVSLWTRNVRSNRIALLLACFSNRFVKMSPLRHLKRMFPHKISTGFNNSRPRRPSQLYTGGGKLFWRCCPPRPVIFCLSLVLLALPIRNLWSVENLWKFSFP